MTDSRNTGETVFGLFPMTAPLDRVMQEVRQQGFADEDIEVRSPIPLAETLSGGPERIGLVPLAVIAGAVGIGVGIFFAAGTAVFYPLLTGGKPIVGYPIVGIVSYETMMLVAIATTFIAMLIKVLSAPRLPSVEDARIEEGLVGLIIRAHPEDPRIGFIKQLLRDAGAQEVGTS